MPTINIPAGIRFALYLLSAIGSVVVAYLFARGIVGEAETAGWAGLVAIINGIAAANTNLSGSAVVQVQHAVVEGDPEEIADLEHGYTDIVRLLVVVLLVVLLVWLVLALF